MFHLNLFFSPSYVNKKFFQVQSQLLRFFYSDCTIIFHQGNLLIRRLYFLGILPHTIHYQANLIYQFTNFYQEHLPKMLRVKQF